MATLCLLASCTADEPGSKAGPSDCVDDCGTETTPPTNEIATTDDTGAADSDNAVLVEGGVVTCPNPALRDDARYERRVAVTPELEHALLVGGGIVAADFSGDGLHDLFLPSETSFQFFELQPDHTFAIRTGAALSGVDLSQGVGGSAADYDGDGDLDLFVTRFHEPNVLLQNNGSGVFTDVTETAGVGLYALRSMSSSWGDFDADGDLDLVVGNYGDTPDAFDDPEMLPGDPMELYRNLGDGTFEDVSYLLPPEVHDAYSFMTAWYDVDMDGYPELFSIHDFGKVRQSRLLDNVDGTFVIDVGSNFHPAFEGMGLGVGDLNDDQQPDFLQTSWRVLSLLRSSSMPAAPNGLLWVEFGDTVNMVPDLGVNPNCFGADLGGAQQCYGWGAELVDLDNDADLDALAIFGYWTTYDNTPRYQSDALFIQGDDGMFEDVASAPEWGFDDDGAGRGALALDFDEDGYLDVIKRELEPQSLLYISNCGDEAWLKVRARDLGPNTHAVGAKVRIVSGGKTQVRWIQSGSTSMFSGGPPEVHFGLGDLDVVDNVEVIWPDQERSVFRDIQTRQVLTVTRTDQAPD